MVQKYDKSFRGRGTGKSIKADIIILGCTLPGIVTAHKLKRKFGNTMDIVVIDLAGPQRNVSKCNVAFTAEEDDSDNDKDSENQYETTRKLKDNVARYYLTRYAKEFSIPLPDVILTPQKVNSPLCKLFQYRNGQTVQCIKDFHDFDYLSFVERFEMTQYQTFLDQSMRDLFQTKDTKYERKRLLYYDRTTMEKHICDALLFSTSREIMRTTVRLVCGASASSVSVLFYLHQCHRTCSARNHLDGDNTKFREKLLGYCRKRLANQLQQSIADITFSAKSIKEIRTYSDEQVILETIKGETNYICNLLAMALKPDQLTKIQVEDQLLSEKKVDIFSSMKPGRAKKFVIQYEENFWGKQGYSGDILSIRGPIIWAMEKPRMSGTGSFEKYSSLIGYLKVRDGDETDSREAVLDQLVKLFGVEAATPFSYKEKDVADVFIPRCGDFVALKTMTRDSKQKHLEWGALDIFAEGDVAAALEAGHTAYLNLLMCLRPQAMTYEDLSTADWPVILNYSPIKRWMANINVISSMQMVVFTAALCMGVSLLKSYIRK